MLAGRSGSLWRKRNPKWLNDDYVKFIRFAQLKMDAVQEGVVGVITNHSWLDNPTFRGMRQSSDAQLQADSTCSTCTGNAKKESAPDGSKDENVFDIEQGVAVSLLLKKPGLERGVWRYASLGTSPRKISKGRRQFPQQLRM